MSEKAELNAYPLTWPAGRPRTMNRERARFFLTGSNSDGVRTRSGRVSVYVALTRLRKQLDMIDARDVVISTNVPTRADGLPYARIKEPADPGVAVYFRLKGVAHCLACDRWEIVAENLAAIAAHVNAIRGQSRWGVGDIAQAFAGYRALPAMGVVKTWWEVLGLGDRPATVAAARAAWLVLIKQYHPDRNGSQAQAAEINAAWTQACDYFGYDTDCFGSKEG